MPIELNWVDPEILIEHLIEYKPQLKSISWVSVTAWENDKEFDVDTPTSFKTIPNPKPNFRTRNSKEL